MYAQSFFTKYAYVLLQSICQRFIGEYNIIKFQPPDNLYVICGLHPHSTDNKN